MRFAMIILIMMKLYFIENSNQLIIYYTYVFHSLQYQVKTLNLISIMHSLRYLILESLFEHYSQFCEQGKYSKLPTH